MTSTPPLNLLPPANASRPDSPPPAPSTDSSFGDALKRAQGRPSDDSTNGSDSTSANQASPSQGDTASASSAAVKAGDGSDKTGAAKKAPEGKAAGTKKSGKDQDSAADETETEPQLDLPVEDATAKQPKKQPGKTVAKPATPDAAPVATPLAPAALKRIKTEVAKADVGKTSENPAVTPAKAQAVEADADAASPASTADETDAATDGLPAGAAVKPAKGTERTGWKPVKNSSDAGSNTGTNAQAALTASAAAIVGSLDSTGSEDGTSAIAAAGTVSSGNDSTDGSSAAALAASLQTPTADTDKTTAPAAAPKLPPQQQFVEDNHPKIVTGVSGQLMPDGGTMQIRLDPPELGTVQVTIHMKNGVMSAAFETANDESTRLLSHSLGQLKSSLEATGVAVEKMHVQQAPKQDGKGTDRDGESAKKQTDQQGQAKRDQQRQDLIKKMWQKLAGGDPLDLVA